MRPERLSSRIALRLRIALAIFGVIATFGTNSTAMSLPRHQAILSNRSGIGGCCPG